MIRILGVGLTCALLAVVAFTLGHSLDLAAQHSVLYSIAGGAVIGLVPKGSPVARYTGFVIGLVLGLVYFALLAIAVPGDWVGQLTAAVVTIVVATLVSAFTRGWVQLWSLFLGALLFIGAYQPMFDNELWLFETESVMTLCTTIFQASVGFCVVIVVELLEPKRKSAHGVSV